ncbi:MAG: putative inorganic carbon transporter subunit DabA [Nitrospirota bacterium]
MGKTEHTPTTETEQMHLLGVICLASEIIAPYFPMRTFVYRNPLHGLERLHFDEAVRLGEWFLEGKGYLSSKMYRDYFHSGRILLKDIDAALSPYAEDKQVVVWGKPISHLEVLRACMLNPIVPSQDRPFKEDNCKRLKKCRDRFV